MRPRNNEVSNRVSTVPESREHVPPFACVLSKDSATTPSLIRMAYFLLRPISWARASAHCGVTSFSIASLRRWARSASLLAASADHSVLIALTNTRVPSLLTATVSERRTRARICVYNVGSSGCAGSGRRSASVLSARHTG